MAYDLIIKNGRVITGIDDSEIEFDIGIKGSIIASIETKITDQSKQTIDASGLHVCPGFIDMHSHNDLEILQNPKSDIKLLQGVTTEVTGNCGFSLFPVVQEYKNDAYDFLSLIFEGIQNKNLFDNSNSYIKAVQTNRSSTNIMPLLGYNMVRIASNGIQKKLSQEKLNICSGIIDKEFQTGLFGMSAGLLYTPACFADISEFSAIAKIVKKYDGMISWHIREEGDDLMPSLEEIIEIARASNASMEISHLKISGKKNWGTMNNALELLDKALETGLDLAFDIYPYSFGSSSIMILFPREVLQNNTNTLINKLQDIDFRNRVIHAMFQPKSLLNNVGPDNIVISSTMNNKQIEGKSLKEISELKNKSIPDTIMDLLIEENGQTHIFLHQMDEKDILLALSHPRASIGTDGIPRSDGRAHPRLYNTFPYMIDWLVNKKKLLSLPAAIKKMTAFPASRLDLHKRSIIAKGNIADICIFDKEKIKDEKIKYVILNGQTIVENNQYNGSLAGKILRRD